ncbi:MAG TPA: glycosyltransferase family 2 protein, partial [Caulobacteraceae bacterium]|nr:glycosyltransferase family 2 protein [Caulobacteraceae bacterium]
MIPAKNAQATVGRAVASALAEPEAGQVVLIDDGSTDATVAVAREAAAGSERLVVRSLPVSGGPAAARNLAIAITDAPWICPLDADDFFQPGRLRRLLAQADGCDFVADDLLMVREGAESAPGRRVIGDREPLPITLDFSSFLEANVSRPGMARREYGFLKPLMRRAFLAQHALAYDESLRLGEDVILYSAALGHGALFKVVPPCGYVAVERAGSLSVRHTTQDLRALRDASARLLDLPGLTSREQLAVRRHVRHLQAKVDLREVLDARREGGLASGIRAIAARKDSVPYMFARMAEDKWDVLRSRRSRRLAIARTPLSAIPTRSGR